MSAIMKRAGFKTAFARPKGGRGEMRLSWLRQEEAARLLTTADALHGDVEIPTPARASSACAVLDPRHQASGAGAFCTLDTAIPGNGWTVGAG
jgi:hypothetical protein